METSFQFGTYRLRDGQTIFRLWAPSAGTVDCFVESDGITHHFGMNREKDGWHTVGITLPSAHHYLYWFQIDNHLLVPDPASRYQPRDVHGPSLLIHETVRKKRTKKVWQGRPWRDAVIYELHVGTFTHQGTLAAATAKLDYLADLGITAVELMPLSDFPGLRNWGYDGVLPYSLDSSYGTIADLHHFIEEAHVRNLMVFLDVVYNHFGPEGNYLHVYAKPFFTDRHKTPWGSAIDFQGDHSKIVRRFFVENALYWLTEFQFDGLRFDAVHAIFDDSTPHILQELAQAIQDGPGKKRHIHLMLENDENNAHYLRWQTPSGKKCYTAQWNDDIHHAFHVLLTGETDGYYSDYSVGAIDHLGRCLTEGFAWQGEKSPYRGNKPRGEPSSDLMPWRFISFLQNHDQIGNRALGERISHLTTPPAALRAATSALLLAPAIPLLFMGQEWAATSPFLFFCHFEPDLASRVTKGRRREFASFNHFTTSRQRARIPDPNLEETFCRSILKWQEIAEKDHRQWLVFHKHLLKLRHEKIVPLLDLLRKQSFFSRLNPFSLRAIWLLQDGRSLILLLNLGKQPVSDVEFPTGECLWITGHKDLAANILPSFFCGWYLSPKEKM